jgi:hypothetical protein
MNAIERLIGEGHAYWDTDGSLVLIASDGEHLSGMCHREGDLSGTLDYLAEFPTPQDW